MKISRAQRRSSRTVKNVIALAVFVALIIWVDPVEVWHSLSKLTLELALYLGAISVLLIYISALKWKLFLEAMGATASCVKLFGLYLVGYFVNLIMPSYIGGDIVRSWYLGRRSDQHRALAATILERYTGLLAMVLLAVAFMWDVSRVSFEIKLVVLGVALLLSALTCAALSERLLSNLEQFGKLTSLLRHARKIQAGLLLAKSNRLLLLKTFGLSLLFHCFTVVNVMAAAYAVGWYDPPVWDLFVVLPLILLIGSIPITPSGLGIQEGAFIFFLEGIGATYAEAFGVGLILRAKMYVLALMGGAVWIRVRNEDRALEQMEPLSSDQAASV